MIQIEYDGSFFKCKISTYKGMKTLNSSYVKESDLDLILKAFETITKEIYNVRNNY